MSPDRKLLRRLAKPLANEVAYILRPIYPTEAVVGAKRSYLGGLPQLPDHSEWPKARSGKPMSFLAQIAASDLPTSAATKSDFADNTILFFFLNCSLDENTDFEQMEAKVTTSDAKGAMAERPAPKDLPSIVDVLGLSSGWKREAVKAFAPTTFPKARLSITAVPTGVSEAQLESETKKLAELDRSLAESQKQGYEPETIEAMRWAGESELRHRSRRSAFEIAAGSAFPAKVKGLFGDRKIDVPWIDRPARTAEADDKVFDLDPNFPWCWLFVEYFAMQMLEELSQNYRRKKLALWTGRLETEAEQWLARAQSSDRTSSLPPLDVAAFQDWMRRLFEAWKTDDQIADEGLSEAEARELRMVRFTYDGAARGILIHTLCDSMRELAATDTLQRLPAEFVTLMQPALTTCQASYCHQMFGPSLNVQNAAFTQHSKVLLLQLVSDKRLGWMWGDMGAIQFWIEPEMLLKHDFSQVKVTLEGY
jgi:hypothetical protein